jgi:hypothetical protein
MEFNKVLQAVSGMNAAELNKVIEAVKNRRSFIAGTKTLTMNAGDRVRVVGGGRIDGQIGKIIKVNQKTVIVDLDGQKWKISSTMLQKI